MNHTIQKINTLGRAGTIICRISRVVLAIGIIALLAAGLLLCFVPRDALTVELVTSNFARVHIDDSAAFAKLIDLGDALSGSISIGGSTYPVEGSMLHDSIGGADGPVAVIGGASGPAQTTTTLRFTDLKWLMFAGAFSLALMYVALYFAQRLCRAFRDCRTPFTEEVSRGMTSLAWSLIPVALMGCVTDSLSNSSLTGGVNLTLKLDLTTVLLVLCVFLLSYVFKYGIALQTEVDETL